MGKQLRYLEIARNIKKKIQDGSFPPGNSLPSQKELSEIFSTSIMTARQALGVLEEEGLITVVHGIGTFVSSPGPDHESLGLQGFQNELDRQKMSITNRIINREYDLRTTRISDIFNETEETFSCLTRLRTVENKPVILQRSWVSSRYNQVINEYREDYSLYQFFMDKTGILITLGHEIASPIILNEKESELLEISTPCPAFLSRRISISLDEKVVLYDEAYLPGPQVIMASKKQGRNNNFKYIIKMEKDPDPISSFQDSDLWEDLK